MKRRIFLIPILIAALVSLGAGQAGADNPPRKVLTGWIPYYSMKTALPDALNNSDLIREVMPFWYTLKFDGKTKQAKITDLYGPANPSIPITTPLDALRGAGFLIIPTITDGTDKLVLSNLLKSPASRTQIVETITSFVMTNNYDGIDLDFEGFAFVDGNTTWNSTSPGWVALVKELGTALHKQNKILSVSTPYVLNPLDAQKGYYVYNWAQIASSIDRLRIMTYDYSVAKPGPLGPISWAERTVQYALTIMPAAKIFVGVPGYGRDWITKVDGICPANVAKAVVVGAKAATFVMRDATALAASYGVVPTYNEQYGEVNFNYQKTYTGTTTSGLATSCTASRTAWYQDARSWTLRANLVTKYRIGGISAWTFGMEEPLAMESVRQMAKVIAPDVVTAELEIDNINVSYGSPILVTTKFSLKDKSPVVNIPVRIEGKSPSDLTWRVLASGNTSQDGALSKSLLIGKSTNVRAVADGTWERSQATSPETQVNVNRVITVNQVISAPAGQPLTISGSVRPRALSAYVMAEREINGAWKAISLPILTDQQGNYLITLAGQSRSIFRYRISVAADAQWPIVSSQIFSIIIR